MYLEIDEGFTTHRKTLRFCGLMQDHNAFAYLLRLWSWATRSAPDGELSGLEAVDIEIAVQYRLADGKCYAAMVKAGFIDEKEAGTPGSIHAWRERTGATIMKFEADAARKKLIRAHNKGTCQGPGKCPHCDRDAAEKTERMSEVEDDGDGGLSDGRPMDGPAVPVGRSDTDQTRPVQARSGSLPPSQISGPDQTPARVSEPPPMPDHEIPRPFRPRLRLPRVGAATLAYLRIYDAYPKKLGKQEAAQVFQELAEDYPGGEAALSAAIMAAFAAGMLKRHPYSGDDEHRPSLEKFLAGRRWEDDESAPDDETPPAAAPPRRNAGPVQPRIR